MLHILWLALKLIGILLAVALALMLLAAALILFCPLAYRVKVEKDDDWKIWGRVHWLFGLVSVTVQKEPSGFQKTIRICAAPAASWKKLFKRKKRRKKKVKEAVGAKNASVAKEFQEEEFQKAEGDAMPKKDDQVAKDGSAPEENIQKAEDGSVSEENIREAKDSFAPNENIRKEDVPVVEETASKKREPLMPAQEEKRQPRRENLIRRLWTRIVEKCQGIRDAFLGFIDAVRKVCGRISEWRSFLGDAHTKAAFGLTWQQLLRLLRHAGPQKWKGHVNLGFENPAVTGQALAVLGAAYPIHKGRVFVNPVWDRAVLEGEVCVKGRVFGIVLLHVAGILYFDKDVKYAIHWFRR